MSKTKEKGGAGLKSAWTTGHAVIDTNTNEARIEAHAGKLRATSIFNKSAGQPFYFLPSIDDAQHKVIFGPTRTGMSAGPILPQVLDLADKPKR